MEVNNYKRKFKLLFEKFFKENFELNCYYSDNLLKYLEDCPDKSKCGSARPITVPNVKSIDLLSLQYFPRYLAVTDGHRSETIKVPIEPFWFGTLKRTLIDAKKILDTPFFSDLIIYSLTNIEKATTSVTTFIMEVVTILLKNELQFSKFVHMQGFQLMASKFGNSVSIPCNSALYLAMIKVATAQISHSTGITWVIENKIWTKILNPHVHHKASKVANAAYNYISRLVWKLNEYDEEAALIEVLQFVIQPIATSPYHRLQVLDADSEKTLYEPIFPYLNALYAIVSAPDILKRNKVVPLLGKYFIIGPSLRFILDMTRNNEIASMLCDIAFRFTYATLKDGLYRQIKTESDIANEITSYYCNFVNLLINKRMVTATLDFIVKCYIFWAKLDPAETPSTFEKYGRTFEIKLQYLILLVVPIISFSYGPNWTNKTDTNKEELDMYHLKIAQITTEHIVKLAYAFRTVTDSGDKNKITIQTLRELLKLKGYLNATQAGIVYQALHYLVQMHVQSDGKGALILNKNTLKSPDDVKLLSLVLDVIKLLLKEHNINWYDSVEIISLQTSLMNLLKQNILPTKQLLQALDLIDLSIKKFLSPDLALLMESKSGSTLNEIGAVMKSYIQHEEWEVRDSALHLLLSCTEVAFIKYIPLQNILSENILMVLATRTALADSEFYVQTTALRCLAAATKIEVIWKGVTIAYPNLYVQLIYMLKNNTEGIVRKEVANVLTELYINQKVTNNFIRCMFSVMAAAALEELHWEVQLIALNFWKHAIQNQLSDRGMIDGKFPSVTFSKQKRKIIVLNDKEIERQLIGMMIDLSSIGCLNVLYKCLNDEDNIDVIEQAHHITKELVEILDRYQFNAVPENSTVTYSIDVNDWLNDVLQDGSENLDVAMDLSYVQVKEPPKDNLNLQHQVIEEIVNTNQCDLILDAFENYNRRSRYIEADNPVKISPDRDVVHPNMFLKHFKETDYKSILDKKTKWNSGLSNFDTLLDEILALGEVNKHMDEECCE